MQAHSANSFCRFYKFCLALPLLLQQRIDACDRFGTCNACSLMSILYNVMHFELSWIDLNWIAHSRRGFSFQKTDQDNIQLCNAKSKMELDAVASPPPPPPPRGKYFMPVGGSYSLFCFIALVRWASALPPDKSGATPLLTTMLLVGWELHRIGCLPWEGEG